MTKKFATNLVIESWLDRFFKKDCNQSAIKSFERKVFQK